MLRCGVFGRAYKSSLRLQQQQIRSISGNIGCCPVHLNRIPLPFVTLLRNERICGGKNSLLFASSRLLSDNERSLDLSTYEQVCEETLQSLTEYLDELLSSETAPPDADVSYGDGILTVKLGNNKGVYVINKQTPNRQIWLSSPVSGPKRYDFIDKKWIYKHDNKTLHTLLSEEMSLLLNTKADFSRCSYS